MKKPNKTTKHHIIPRSRQKKKKLMGVCLVPAKQHNLYHCLVGNMTPMEAFEFFNKTFWGKLFVIVETYKEKKV
jgi:hypothetical protein